MTEAAVVQPQEVPAPPALPAGLHKARLEYGKAIGSETPYVLTNADESRFYCAEDGCGYSADRFMQVFAHRSRHGREKKIAAGKSYKGTGQAKRAKVSEEATLTVAIDLLTRVRDAAASQDTAPTEDPWKARALAAEAKLRRLQKTFRNLVSD